MTKEESRRQFLKEIAGLYATGVGLSLSGCASGVNAGQATHSSTDEKSWAGLRAKPLDRVRFGMIGTGDRGGTHVRLLNLLEHAEVVAVADPHQPSADAASALCVKAGNRPPDLYTDGEHDYLKLLKRSDIDAVVISTPWKWHCKQAVAAMKAGKHAFVEVPLALTIDELWQVVKTSESTGRHCMMLENVNYGRDEMMVLNMCRSNLFGELLHGEAAYIHDLRYQMKDMDHGTGSWRTGYHVEPNGNLYPTHGLGPIAQYMNLDRTDDRFDTLASMSSLARGRDLYAEKHFPEGHPRRQVKYRCGDINTSIIRTNMGRTIMVQWDTTSPRPYTRHNLIQGTGGSFADYPPRLAIEGRGNYHEWTQGPELEEVRAEFEHPLWKRLQTEAEKAGGHGGMDYMMLYRIVECLRTGSPMDQNVYEGASWSAVRPLSRESVLSGGKPVAFPDFTRGKWRHTAPLAVLA